MKKIIIYTRAYNSEKTIRRAIESVLNQTYKNFIYYVLNNGSTDKTGEIILDYKENDTRIKYLHNEINNPGIFLLKLYDIIQNEAFDFFSTLDSDDEYLPEFLEKSLAFAEENNLDLVCCGTNYVNTSTGEIINQRMTQENLVIDNDKVIETYFPVYSLFISAIWGKLFSKDLLNYMIFDIINLKKSVSYVSDNCITCLALKKAKSFGILSGIHHKYYKYKNQISNTLFPGRFIVNSIEYDLLMDFLKSRCGRINNENKKIITGRYMGQVASTLEVLVNLDVETSLKEKISLLYDIFTNTHTREAINMQDYYHEKERILSLAMSFILLQDKYKAIEKQGKMEETKMILFICTELLVFCNNMFETMCKEKDTQFANLETKYNTLLNSRSIRFTQPIRKVAILIRKNKVLYYAVKSVLSLKRKLNGIR